MNNKTTVLALVFACGLITQLNGATGDLILKKGDRIAIVGDSITEQRQYSKFMEIYLLACIPEMELTTCQFGWSGEQSPHFFERMQNDLLPWHPTVVTTCYGMNDGHYCPYTQHIGETYRRALSGIQAECKKRNIRMVVGGPGAVDTYSWRKDKSDDDKFYNDNLSKLSEIAGNLAISNGFVFASLHSLMIDVMKNAKAKSGQNYTVCGSDGVHPQANGHLVMAYAFLKAMGLDGNIGTITIDMATGKATATEQHKILSSTNGTIEIKSTRYPFCFFGKETDPNGTRSILPFLPFNQDLNRYILVVNNLSTPMAEITWGNTTKAFTKECVENGINLAAEFIDNPFCKPFMDIDKAVSQKQKRETYIIKGIITNFLRINTLFPNNNDKEMENAIAIIENRLWERNAQDAAMVRASVKPVIHTIQITPLMSL